MATIRCDIDDRVVETIASLFHERVNTFGLSDVKVRASEDHVGHPVIFVDAVFELTPRPIEPDVFIGLQRVLHDAVRALGESRFVHTNYKFDDAQTVAGRRRSTPKHPKDARRPTSVRLAPAVVRRLDELARRTGRTKAYHLRELVTNGLDDLEDYYLASATLERTCNGEEPVHTAETVRRDLGLE